MLAWSLLTKCPENGFRHMSSSSTAKFHTPGALEGVPPRAAVRRALREQLPNQEAERALLLWDEHVAAAQNAAVSAIDTLMAFVTTLSRRFELSTSALRRSLFYALSTDDTHVASDAVPTETPPVSSWPEGLSGDDIVINALLSKVRDLAGRTGEGRDGAFTQSLRQRLSRIGLSASGVEVVRAWCTDPGRPVQGLSRQEMEKLVRAVYVACSDACGPVSADRAFAGAIREVEKLPQAIALSPRALL